MIDQTLQELYTYIGHGAVDPDREYLYGLARIMKSYHILELGTDGGRGTAFLAAACHANGGGVVVSVDIREDAGQQIPDYLRGYITLINADIDEFIDNNGQQYHLIFEDGNHTASQVAHIWGNLKGLLYAGGIIASHDIADDCGAGIKEGIRKAGFDINELFVKLSPPSKYGLGIWRKS